ncbi:MAG: outer membrane protein transport protein [Pelomonas sp.]|nr:outer membrane protein transport protein [Roseateles sp.]
MALVAACATLACADAAHAAAFQLKEQSALAQGRAFAGSISEPGDASVVANNPAAMTLLKGRVFQADASVIDYSVKFSGAGNDAIGRPLGGGNGGDAGATAGVPSLYLHLPVSDRLRVGLSVTVPFGFKTSYQEGWAGRYEGIKTELKAYDLGAALAYKVTDSLSLGASVFAERADVKLRDAVDYGAILAGARVAGFLPTGADGDVRIHGKHTAAGFTLGALFKPSADTSIGLAYRSKVEHKIDSVDVRFSVPAAAKSVLAVARPGWFVDTTASAEMDLPSSYTLSVSQRVNARWRVMADFSRTKWSQFRDIDLDFASNQATQTLVFGYRDTSFYSVGSEYEAGDGWTLRAGLGYDQSPVTDAVRDVRVPDTNRRWIALGATWQASERLKYSLAYTHLFLGDPSVDLRSATGSTLRGTYKLGSDVLAASVQYSF